MSKKVLIIDDSDTVRQLVATTLGPAGFFVVKATNGIEGVDVIEQTPDLSMVICDINMPGMNGLEVLERIKSGGKHPTLPIIMLTTEGDPTIIDQAKKAGAKGWMVKPFKTTMLIAAVRKLTA